GDRFDGAGAVERERLEADDLDETTFPVERRHAAAVVRQGPGDARAVGAVPVPVPRARAAAEGAAEVLVRGIDAGVEDGDDGFARRLHVAYERVHRVPADGGEAPLLRGQRVVGEDGTAFGGCGLTLENGVQVHRH